MGLFDRIRVGLGVVRGSLNADLLLFPVVLSFLFFAFSVGLFVLAVLSAMFFPRAFLLLVLLIVVLILVVYPLYVLLITKNVLQKSGINTNKITFPMLFWFSMTFFTGTYFVKMTEDTLKDSSLPANVVKVAWFYFKYFLPAGFLTAKEPIKGVQEALKAVSKVYLEVAVSALAVNFLLFVMIGFSIVLIFLFFVIYPSIAVFLTVLSVTLIISFLIYYSLRLAVSARLYAYSLKSEDSIFKDIKEALKKVEVL